MKNKLNGIKKVHFFILLYTFSILFSLNSQEQLSSQNTSWSSVLSGNVNSGECITSYGFCLQTDARTISSYSSSGTLLWEKSVSRSKDTDIYPLENDFILLSENQTNKIKMINPSGNIIWENELNSPLIQPPLDGRDGRFFIFLSEEVLCFTKTGDLRWTYKTPVLAELAAQEFPDGTILVFCGQKDGKTLGLRLSPFGDALEEITFSGAVINSGSCRNGIALYFTDGSFGLLGLDENQKAVNKWVLETKSTERKFCISQDKNSIFLLENQGSGIKVYDLENSTGTVNSSFSIPAMNVKNLLIFEYTDAGLFVCDAENAFLYSKDGIKNWEAKMPGNSSKSDINYTNVFLTPEGYLVFCEKNWNIKAFRVFQASKKIISLAENYDFFTITPEVYEYLYTSGFDSSVASEKIIKELKDSSKTGLKAGREIQISSDVYSAISAYYDSLSSSDFGTRKEKSIFETDTKGFERILRELTLLHTDISTSYISHLIFSCTNRTYLSVILEGIIECGYDPEQKILNSLEILASKIDYKSTATLAQICDAVYSICNFMGKPAWNSRGKEILKKFLYPSYNSSTRDHARKVLQQISELDL